MVNVFITEPACESSRAQAGRSESVRPLSSFPKFVSSPYLKVLFVISGSC